MRENAGLSRIQPFRSEDAVSLKLAEMKVNYINRYRHKSPMKTGEEKRKKIRDRYLKEKLVLATFTSSGQMVVVAELNYFAQPTIQFWSHR